MDEVRIGIAGIGGMGSNHATYLSRGEVPQARLTAVSDTGDERLTWAQQTLGESVSRFDDAEAMIW